MSESVPSTPYERFAAAMKRIVSVPKAEVDRRAKAERKRRRAAKKRKG